MVRLARDRGAAAAGRLRRRALARARQRERFRAPPERRGGGVGGGKAFTRLANAATNVVSQGKHVGGEAGSIATTLPLDPQHCALTISTRALTISTRSLTFWDFGMQFLDDEPREAFRLDRDQLQSIERTGKTRQGGQVEARLTFVDGSYADWALHTHEAFDRGFWAAAERVNA